MFDNEDLKWLASQATELNRLIQQVARHTDQVRQHQCELRYLELLTERVGLASRRSQELFDLITSRILTGGNAPPPVAPAGRSVVHTPAARSITPAPGPSIQTTVRVKIPVDEIKDYRE